MLFLDYFNTNFVALISWKRLTEWKANNYKFNFFKSHFLFIFDFSTIKSKQMVFFIKIAYDLIPTFVEK